MKTPENGHTSPEKTTLNIESLVNTPEYSEFVDKVRANAIEPTFTEHTHEDTVEWDPHQPNLTKVFRDDQSETSKKYRYVFYWYSDEKGDVYLSQGLGGHELGGSMGYFKFEK